MKNNADSRQKIWLVRARETLRDANVLYQQGGSSDGVIDRGFYSMLYAVFALLMPINKKGLPEENRVVSLFNDKFVKHNVFPKEMGRLLYDAHNLHRAAEFQDFFTPNRDQAVETLNSATEFVKAIETKLSQGLVSQ